MMYEFARNQFINFHGLQGSRLNFEQSIHDQKFTRSTLMSILSPMFFYTPDVHRTALHKIFVDNIASSFTWNKFVDKVNSELQEQNLLATVLLNANVGFLAIQTVDNGSNIGTNNDVTRSPTQVASYLSLVASAGSIILGLVLLRHNRTKARETAEEAAKFLHNMGHKKYGQEALALIYSLPYALLMWGMLLFLAAFLIECYYPRALAPSLIVGVASLAVFALTSGCIYVLNTEQNGRQKWWLKKILATRQEPEAVVELQPANSAQGPPAIVLRQATLRPDIDNSANGPSQV
ncbi:hypothetical protein SERLADRAFT_458015 [Serpula lacrymans var. lacrymans S7.9]|uniref:Uncharacterized protein n=1 Tax=Serpula lacrymans var. lacrymans (strain S7.9) TaxID=578457 RepID=F8NIK8_SERL9|nr:uncharacterized protein SERLADRAFT_458015 [Serpula lacrymans var. lacrymans S7.9]EGO29770.1 hypothetical protein SERLADRAFT_458015 [Serpula lacrymans var. lacrymans S7.9]